MKVRRLVCKIVVSRCMFALACLALFPGMVLANGPGIPITPYKKGTKITVEDIEKVRAQSNSERMIRGEVRTKDQKVPVYAERVGLVYVTGNGEVGEPAFELRGTTESGGNLTVPLSDVISFTVLKVEGHWFARDRALLNVTVFPSVSPSELLGVGPTYSQLKETYTKQMRMWVFLEDENKGRLGMAGKKWNDTYELLFAIRNLEINAPVVLGWSERANAPIWWAVESVVKDDEYPYRIIMLK